MKLLLALVITFSMNIAFAQIKPARISGGGGKICPQYVYCPTTAPKGCTLTKPTLSKDGCTVCGTVKCPVTQICPMVSCAAPPVGCYYQAATDLNGCTTCGTLVCDKITQ